MDFSSIAVAGPLFTSAAALIVGGVTRWTQRGVARDRIRWEARLEVAKLNEARFAVALDHLIQAADAANRYIVRSDDFDVTDYDEREPYVLPILDSIGRARVEVAALPAFVGKEEVDQAIKSLESVVSAPESAKDLMRAWEPDAIGAAITLLSRERSLYVERTLGVVTPEEGPRRRLFAWRCMVHSPRSLRRREWVVRRGDGTTGAEVAD
ncbi:hypothetical protein [Streptomyces chrestomyceticus]|uniref:hypothetical protein n=1 Tax=Streptomyces chrestomyceticus TaxID=68185 RepID=UPI0033F10D0B